MATIRLSEQQQLAREEQARRDFYKARSYVGIPVPSKKQENKDKFGGGNREDRLDEWEKNQVKRLFRQEFDKDKQGIASREELRRLIGKLLNDDCIIGKIPRLTEEETS